MTNIFEDNEMILYDRLEIIKQVYNEYGDDKMYISFSGGKDVFGQEFLVNEVNE